MLLFDPLGPFIPLTITDQALPIQAKVRQLSNAARRYRVIHCNYYLCLRTPFNIPCTIIALCIGTYPIHGRNWLLSSSLNLAGSPTWPPPLPQLIGREALLLIPDWQEGKNCSFKYGTIFASWPVSTKEQGHWDPSANQQCGGGRHCRGAYKIKELLCSTPPSWIW